MLQILERALRACEAAEVFSVKKVSTPVEFESNKIKKIETAETSGIALRVIKDGKIGFSSTTKPEDVQNLIANAVATARFGAPASFSFPGPSDFVQVDNYASEVPGISIDRMVEIGQGIVDEIRAEHPDLLVGVTLEKSVQEYEILNSSGLSVSHRTTFYGVFVVAELITGENFLYVYDGASGAGAEMDLGPMLLRLKQKIRAGLRNAALPTGRYPVLLTPLALQDLIRPIVACINGRAVERGVSPWKDRLGQQVADPKLYLYDDQTRPGAVASSPFDDEGTPSRKLPIIEGGVLKNFALDLRTAAVLGTAPTGNGKRDSIESAPAIGTSTLVIEPGTAPVEEIIQSIKKGVVIDVLMGAWSGNPYGGAVNGNIMLGFVVENGEITGRIKNAMFSTNAFEALTKQLAAISKEQIDYNDTIYPYVLLDGAGIVTKD